MVSGPGLEVSGAGIIMLSITLAFITPDPTSIRRGESLKTTIAGHGHSRLKLRFLNDFQHMIR